MWLDIARVQVWHALFWVVGCMRPSDLAFEHTYMMALTAWSAKTPTCGQHGWMGPQKIPMCTGPGSSSPKQYSPQGQMFSTHQINPRPNARILKTGMTKLSKQPSKCAGWGVTPTHHLLAYRAWADNQRKIYVWWRFDWILSHPAALQLQLEAIVRSEVFGQKLGF